MKLLKQGFLLALGLLTLTATAQEDLLVGKTITTLGDPLTWTNDNGSYTFDITNDQHNLNKLVQDPTNTDNVWIYPETQNGANFDNDASRAVGPQGFYIDMEETYTIGSVYTTWEGACATAYDIYLTNSVPNKNTLPTPAISATDMSGTEQTVALTSNNTGRYLVFQAKTATNWGWGIKIRSITAYGEVDDELTGFTVSPTIVKLGDPTPLTVSVTNQLGLPITDGVSINVSNGNATYANGNLTINSGSSATLTASHNGNSLNATVYAATAPREPDAGAIGTPVYTNTLTDKNGTAGFQCAYNKGATDNGEITFDNGTVARSFSGTHCIFLYNSETTGGDISSVFPEENEWSAYNIDIFGGCANSGTIEFEGTEGGEGKAERTNPFTLTPGEWITVTIPLLNTTKLNNISIRFDDENVSDILLANIYFSPMTIAGDTNPPVINTLTADSPSATSIVVTMQATDNENPNLTYTIIVNDTDTYTVAGQSGETVQYTITGLEHDTEYTIAVTVSDGVNDSETKTVTCVTDPLAASDMKGISMDSSLQVVEGNNVDVNVLAITLDDEVCPPTMFGSLTLTCSNPDAVEITDNGKGSFTIKGLISGVYTLTAEASEGTVIFSASAKLYIDPDWDTTENIAVGTSATARWLDSAESTEYTAEKAVDGNNATYYQYNGDWGGGDSWVVVDLGAPYIINAVGVYYPDGNRGTFKYSLGSENAVLPEGDYLWNNDEALEGWTYSAVYNRQSDAIVSYVPEEASLARYIAVRDMDNPAGKPMIGEIYVSGIEYKNPVATSIVVTIVPDGLFPGEEAQLGYAVKDQYGLDFETTGEPEVKVTNATYAEGVLTAGDPGDIIVTVNYGELSAKAKAFVADSEKYVMNGAEITSDTNAENGEYAIDGGADPDSNGNLFVVIENEPQGPASHWILAKLARPCDLDMIALNWEGACPADYDVYVGSAEDNLVKLYSVTGHTQAAWKDRFWGQSMDNVRYIRIVTSSNATGYGIKLYEIKAYGEQSEASQASSVTVAGDLNYIATDETVALTAQVLDQFGAEMPDEPVVFYANGVALADAVFAPEVTGDYNITAKNGELESKPLVIHVIAIKESRLENPDCVITLDGEVLETNPFTQETTFADVDMPLVFTFDAPMDFGLLKFNWEAACPSEYVVSAKFEDGSEADVMVVKGRQFEMGVHPVDRLYISDGNAVNATLIGANAQCAAVLNGITELTVLPIAKEHGYPMRLLSIDAYGTEGAVVSGVKVQKAETGIVDVYTINGMLVKKNINRASAVKELPAGIYIIGGKKVVVR